MHAGVCPVRFDQKQGKRESFLLGRLDDILGLGQPGSLGLYFGTVFGVQWGLLYFTPDHLGLQMEGSFWQCAVVTLDNACHGIFLDFFELYRISFGPQCRFWHGQRFGRLLLLNTP